MTSIPHLAIPVQLSADGSLATVEQDSPQEITSSVSMLLGTLPGTRPMVPGYGLPDPVFTAVTPGDVQALVAAWEPRATVAVQVTGQGRLTTVAVAVAVEAGQ